MIYKRNRMLLFILLFILSVILRYPVVTHELGIDSFVNHMTINFILDKAGPDWIMHPLQFLGFGEMLNMQMTISGISQVAGLDVEKSILYYSFIIGAIGIMGFYILIYLVTNDFIVAYICSLLFSISPEYIRLTTWTATTRSFLFSLLPIFLYFTFRSISEKDFKSILFAIVFLFILMGSHNIITFVFFMIFAIISSVLISKFKISITVNNKQLNYVYLFLLVFSSFLSFILFKLGPYASNPNLWSKYSNSLLFIGEDARTLFFNMAINYTNKIGFLLVIALVGIIYLFKKNELTIFDKFCLTFILMMSPLLGVGTYVPIILMLPLLYLISNGLLELNNNSNNNLNIINVGKNTILILLIVCAVGFSIFISNYWKSLEVDPVDSIQYSKETSEFLKTYGNGTYIPNHRSFAYRWTAYSGVTHKPYNIPKTNNDRYVPYLVFDKKSIKTGKVMQMVRYKKISTSTKGNSVRDMEETIPGEFWYAVNSIWAAKVYESKSYFDSNRVKYTVETNIDAYSNTAINKMSFFVDVHSNKGKIYDTGVEEMWYI